MKMNKLKKIHLGLWLSGILLAACTPDAFPTRLDVPETDAAERAELCLNISQEHSGDETKASLLRDVESKGSGALVLVFRSATRQLDSYRFFTQAELDAQAGTPLKLRVPLTHCDFYVLGNLNGIRKSGGGALNLMEALGADFPMEEADLEALAYRLDGGDLNGSCRRETFAEVATLGIPYQHVVKDVDVVAQIAAGGGIPGSTACRRLFSKVTLRIDHGAFDGGVAANKDFFVNAKLYLRQANGRLQPFSTEPVKAESAADVLAQSDYDPDMSGTNASVTTFSFYVPENMQGTLLPSNTDSRAKKEEALPAAVRPYVTFVEFTGRVNPAAGGYGGNATYRFYVGTDATKNFDVIRGREYSISLSFRLDALLGSISGPDWKVSVDGWSDNRLFCLTADPAWTDRLPEGKTLAVRANREGAVYFYMNPQNVMGGSNALLGKDIASGTFTPANLADCAWTADFIRPGTSAARWLSDRGIAASYDKASGRLTFSVTDRTRFDAALAAGAETILTARLLPDAGGTSEVSFKLKLYPDISVKVADGLSLTDEFYLGQRRRVSVSGFSGSRICYAADQDPCGASATGAAHTANRQWKTSASASAACPTAKVDAEGRLVLNPSDYASQTLSGGSLDVCAFYPNHFLASHSGWTSKTGRIIFFSEDYLNDSFSVDVRISEPQLSKPASGSTESIVLPFDGTAISTITRLGYKTFDGSAWLDVSSFDPSLYASLLALGTSYASSRPLLACVQVDDMASTLCIARTEVSGAGRLQDQSFNASAQFRLGSLNINANPATGLYGSGLVVQEDVTLSVLKISDFNAPSNGVKYFSDGTLSAPIDQFTDDETFSVPFKYYYKNGDLSRIEWSRSGAATTYTCSSGEKIGPVIEVKVDREDGGSGGSLLWTYDESHQVMRTASGEGVPGGLIMPYGPQTVTGKITNLYDGGTYEVSSDFVLKYASSMCVFVAANRSRYASVYVLPRKHVKYLKRLAGSVSYASRHWMMTWLGTDAWQANTRAKKFYQKRSGINDYYRISSSSDGDTFPRLNEYDVQYLQNADGFTPGSMWNEAAIRAVEASGALEVVSSMTSTPGDGQWGSDYIYGSGLAVSNAARVQKGYFLDSTGAF